MRKLTRRAWALSAAFAISCGRGGGKPNQEHLKVIAGEGETEFPARAELLYEDTSVAVHGLWIVRADLGYTMPGEKLMVDPAMIRTEIEKHIPISDIGELMDPMGERWAWENAKGRWVASSIHGTGGYFLHMERFAKS